jgi:hypothetical protein
VIKCLLPLASTNVIQAQIFEGASLFVWIIEGLCALQDGFLGGLFVTPLDEGECNTLMNIKGGIKSEGFYKIASSLRLAVRTKVCLASTKIVSAIPSIKPDGDRVCFDRLIPCFLADRLGCQRCERSR